MKTSDVFILYDLAQFVEKDYHQRNRLRVNNTEGYKWFTVPVEKKRAPINSIRIDNDHLQYNRTWSDIHYNMIEFNYKGARYYDDHNDFIRALYGKKWDKLIDLNLTIIDYLKDVFNIKAPVLLSSRMECFRNNGSPEDETSDGIGRTAFTRQNAEQLYQKNLRATQNIINMCKEVGADTFMSGVSGRDYLVTELFDREGIKLTYQAFNHPVYRQCYSPFVPNMSSLDYIMNADAGNASF